MAFLVCLLFRESIGVAITKSFVIFVRKFFVSSGNCTLDHSLVIHTYNMIVYTGPDLLLAILSLGPPSGGHNSGYRDRGVKNNIS